MSARGTPKVPAIIPFASISQAIVPHASHGSARMDHNMKALLLFLACRVLLAQGPPAGERHEFLIASFRTESGTTLPQARVVYGTYGKLNADRSNAVLLPSHYMANFHGYEWLIGP